ncbi:MAG TPA: hypothetical protein VND20_06685 [Candidatus Binataceae bacterium]|nr:hypothetical protein [Candidatus Binataceae bacterium]HVC44488.1 hypothetical protein [Candidatus Binataceae bacterium]
MSIVNRKRRAKNPGGPPRTTRAILTGAKRASLAAAIAAGLALIAPAVARAARVSGSLTTYRGAPYASRDLHFENCVTRDIYLSPTHSDGSFAQHLPSGCYNLRTEHGAILAYSIIVGDANVNLGTVSELAPLAPARLFHLQSLFPTLLTSPAPSTAYIFTHDSTVVPANAAKVPVPSSQSEWIKLQQQMNNGVGAKAGADHQAMPVGGGDPNAATQLGVPMGFDADAGHQPAQASLGTPAR